MTARFDGLCFVDTNVWLYAFILSQDEEKHAIATQIIETLTDVVINTQVLNELCVNLIKKAEMGEAEIQRLIRSFYARYPIVAFDESMLLDASELRGDMPFLFGTALLWPALVMPGLNFFSPKTCNITW